MKLFLFTFPSRFSSLPFSLWLFYQSQELEFETVLQGMIYRLTKGRQGQPKKRKINEVCGDTPNDDNDNSGISLMDQIKIFYYAYQTITLSSSKASFFLSLLRLDDYVRGEISFLM